MGESIDTRDGVIVVGGGYAGLHAVRAVASRSVPVTLVDREGRHDFVTRLASVAGGTAPLGDAGRPIGEFASDVERAAVAEVGDGWVRLVDDRILSADAVVVTTGAEVSRPPIEGIEHAYGLRNAQDAAWLRSAIAEAESLVIIGGGATGVQLAGAASIAHPGLRIELLEAEHRLLAGLPAELASGARRILGDRGVVVRLGHSVERITTAGVETAYGSVDGIVVWAGGFEADTSGIGLPTAEDGRILVDDRLRVRDFERTFAAGDVAAHVDGRGDRLPMSAQVAVGAGSAAGANAARLVRGRDLQRVRLSQIGWVLDLGGRRGVARVGPFSLSAPFLDQFAPVIHDLIDLKNLLEIGGAAGLRFAPSSVTGPLGCVSPDVPDAGVRPRLASDRRSADR